MSRSCISLAFASFLFEKLAIFDCKSASCKLVIAQLVDIGKVVSSRSDADLFLGSVFLHFSIIQNYSRDRRISGNREMKGIVSLKSF